MTRGVQRLLAWIDAANPLLWLRGRPRVCLRVVFGVMIGLISCSRSKAPVSQLDLDTLRPATEWLQEESIRLLHDYVRIRTTAAHGEIEGVEFLRRFFECADIETEIVCPAPRRCNLLARLPGRQRAGALLLLHHVDVVDVYPPYWKEAPPFQGLIKIGYLYGRGSYDDKSLGIAQALAMRDVKRLGVIPRSDILFLAEADEESGQRYGSRWLLENRPEWFSGVGQVLNEGGIDEMIIRTVRFWGLQTVQAGSGLISFQAHSPEALTALASRWKQLPGRRPVTHPHPHVVQSFEMLANHLSYPLTDQLRHLERVLRNPEEISSLPDRYAAFLEARAEWSFPYRFPPAGPDFREYVSVYTPPGEAPDSYLDPIVQDAKRNGIDIVEIDSSGPTTASPYPTAFTEILRRVMETDSPGVPFGPYPTIGGTTTSIYFQQKGYPAYGFSPMASNVGDASRRHGNDERVFLRDYLKGIELLKEVVLEFAYAR